MFIENVSWIFDPPNEILDKSIIPSGYSTETCLIVANGPSLNKTNVEDFSSIFKIGMNRAYLSDRNDLNFNLMITVNSLVVTQFLEDFKSLNIPVVTLFKYRKLFANSKNFVVFVKRKLFTSKLKFPDYVLIGHTVTNLSIQTAIHLGFKKILIVGLDHNFTSHKVNQKNKVEVKTDDVDVDHFHPNYFPKNSKWETPDLPSSEAEYKILNEYAKQKEVRILDCTPGGRCNIFEKSTLNKEKLTL